MEPQLIQLGLVGFFGPAGVRWVRPVGPIPGTTYYFTVEQVDTQIDPLRVEVYTGGNTGDMFKFNFSPILFRTNRRIQVTPGSPIAQIQDNFYMLPAERVRAGRQIIVRLASF